MNSVKTGAAISWRLSRYIISAFAIAAICFSQVQAAQYYVDPASGSMSNNGSSGSPWSTLEAVFTAGKTFAAGDVINLRDGHHGHPTVTGHNSANVIIQAQSGHTPELRKLVVDDASNWEITGLTISPETVSSYEQGNIVEIRTNTSDVTLSDCFIYSTLDSSGWTASNWTSRSAHGIDVSGQDHLITGNHLLNVRHGIRVAEASGARPSSQDITVSYNVVENFAGDGIRGLANYCTFEYNVVKNCYDVDGNHDDGFQSWTGGYGGNSVGSLVQYGIVLRGNVILNQTDPNQPHAGGLQGIGNFDGFFEDFVIENNLIVTNHWHGITLMGATNCRIVNNTVVKGPFGSSDGPPWIQIVNHKSGAASTGNLVRNNLTSDLSASGSIGTVDSNIESTNYTAHFVDYANFDFHLKSSSSAVDAGSSSQAPAIDLEQNTRVAPIDVGAYEYGAAPSDTQAPSVPQNLTVESVTNVSAYLTWSASSDNVGVAGYVVYTDGGSPVAVSGTSATIEGLASSTSYSFTVSAFDAADNESAQSSPVVATTGGSGAAPYPQNLLTNSNFESFQSGGLASNWSLLADSASTFTTSEDVGLAGSAQKIEQTVSPGWGLVIYQNPGFVNGTDYEWRIRYKTSGSNTIKAEIANLGYTQVVTQVTLPGTNGAWSEQVIFFTHNNSSANLLRIATANTGTFWLDGMALWVEGQAPPQGQAPTITTQPQGQTVEYGDDPQFTVAATGDPTPSFQWRKDGNDISGATGSSLTIPDATFNDQGNYDVVVSNSAGSVTSSTAVLTVQDTIAPTTPQGLAASNVTSTSVDLSWSASSDNVAVDGYRVYTNGQNPVAVSGVSTTIAGLSEDTQYTFTVTAVDASSNESTASASVQVQTDASGAQPYASNMVTNGNFTSFQSSGIASNWSVISGSSTSYTASQDTGLTGDAQKISVSSSTDWGLVLYQNPGFSSGTDYELRVRYKTSGSNSIKAEVANLNFTQVVLNATLPGTNGAWSEEIIQFYHNNSSANLIRIATNNAGDFWLDGVAIWEATQTPDTQSPTVPTGLVASNETETTVDLDWNASSDNLGVAGYNIYIDGANPLSTTGTSVTITQLSPDTSYAFTVSAYDAASNESAQSTAVNATTESSSSGPLVYEDFATDASAFTVVSGGVWSVVNGRYVLSNPASPSTVGVLANISVHNTSLSGDFVVSAIINTVGTSSPWNDAVIVFGYQDFDNYYYCSLNESNDAYTMGILKVVDGAPTELANINIVVNPDTDYLVEVQRTGNTIIAKVDGAQVASASDGTFIGGRVGVGTYDDSAQFDDFTVTGQPDTLAPSTPSSLVASNVTDTTVDLDWNPSSDNVGVAGYNIYIDGANPQSITGTSATITQLTPNTNYDFSVSAYDAASNESAQSSSVNVTTQQQMQQVAAPVLSPAGGSYSSAQNVTITTATSGATIRYTIDGSTPSQSNGTIYSGPVVISSSATLRAIAYKSGMIDSSVASATYSIGAQGAYPSPSNTGWQHTGVTLTPISGNMTISTDGYVLDSADVSGLIYVAANNVTIKRSRIRAAGGGNAVITQPAGYSGLQVIDCEIDGLGNSSNGVACKEGGLVLRCHIYGTNDGVRPWHNTVIQDNYIYLRAPAGAHSDGVQTFGANFVDVIHNTIDIGLDNVTACVFIDNGSHHITIQDNHFNGGSYTLYANSTYLVITDNVFGQDHSSTCGRYGAVTGWNGSATGNLWSNNNFEDGSPVIP